MFFVQNKTLLGLQGRLNLSEKVNRKIQEEAQAEAAAIPRHQEEEKQRHRP